MSSSSPSEDDRAGSDVSTVLLLLAETIERLVTTVQRELDADSNEGVEFTEGAWAESSSELLACAEASRGVLDRSDVVAALSLTSAAVSLRLAGRPPVPAT